MRAVLGAVVAIACMTSVARAEPARVERFEPATTYAVVVGVLHWRDRSFTTYPAEDRKDQELYDLLARRGVPESQRILLLDEQATTAHATAAIAKLAAAAPKGSTFLFYYAGHGAPSESGADTMLASYDTRSDDMDATGLGVGAIAKALGAFHGGKVILLADACYTGGLAKAADAMWARQIPAFALTSATAANTSTGSWTFTQTVIDALSGRAELDANGDRAIDLAELDAAVGDAMTHRENQAHGFANHGVSAHLVIADAHVSDLARTTGGLSRGDWVRSDGEIAKVLGARDGKVLLSFYDYATETQRWVSPKSVSRVGAAPAASATLLVEWHGTWWPATLVATRGGQSCIHYTGYDDSWNECVGPARLRAP